MFKVVRQPAFRLDDQAMKEGDFIILFFRFYFNPAFHKLVCVHACG